MAKIERSIEAKAPVEKVWFFMTDLEKWPTFMKDIKKVEYVTEEIGCVGAKTHFVVEPSGQQIEWEADFVEWAENKKVAWRSTSGLKNNGYWSLEPTQIGTRITFMNTGDRVSAPHHRFSLWTGSSRSCGHTVVHTYRIGG